MKTKENNNKQEKSSFTSAYFETNTPLLKTYVPLIFILKHL